MFFCFCVEFFTPPQPPGFFLHLTFESLVVCLCAFAQVCVSSVHSPFPPFSPVFVPSVSRISFLKFPVLLNGLQYHLNVFCVFSLLMHGFPFSFSCKLVCAGLSSLAGYKEHFSLFSPLSHIHTTPHSRLCF